MEISDIFRKLSDKYSIRLGDKVYFYMSYIQEYGWRDISNKTPITTISTSELENLLRSHLSEKLDIFIMDDDEHRTVKLKEYTPHRTYTERVYTIVASCTSPELFNLDELDSLENEIYSQLISRDVVCAIPLQDQKYTKLVEWIYEVCAEFQLNIETYFLSVEILSRYLHHTTPENDKLQLHAVASMVIAGKVEEIWHPPIDDYIYISDKTCTRNEIITTERDILSRLEYNILFPSTIQFLKIYLRVLGLNDHRVIPLASRYIITVFSCDILSRSFKNSVVAISAIQLSNILSGKTTIFDNIIINHFDICNVQECTRAIERMFIYISRNSNTMLNAIITTERYSEIAKKMNEYYSRKSSIPNRKLVD